MLDRVSQALRREVYKDPRPHEQVPTIGDFAEIIRDHHNDLTGMVVEVVNEPHKAEVFCSNCGQALVDWLVEIRHNDARYPAANGPYYYPIHWLKKFNKAAFFGSTAIADLTRTKQ